jgi:MFS family permease
LPTIRLGILARVFIDALRLSIVLLRNQAERSLKYRYRVGALLFLLAVITFLDRVCISVAGPRIQEYLQIGPQQWGWVVGVFAIAYAVFEIPGGWMGDRYGPRITLTRIVLWWSAFTSAHRFGFELPLSATNKILIWGR